MITLSNYIKGLCRAPKEINCHDSDCRGLMGLIPYSNLKAYQKENSFTDNFVMLMQKEEMIGYKNLSHYKCDLCNGYRTIRAGK